MVIKMTINRGLKKNPAGTKRKIGKKAQNLTGVNLGREEKL
jgi:hypothetical protein